MIVISMLHMTTRRAGAVLRAVHFVDFDRRQDIQQSAVDILLMQGRRHLSRTRRCRFGGCHFLPQLVVRLLVAMSNQAIQETSRLPRRILLLLGLCNLLLQALFRLLVEFVVIVEIGWTNISSLPLGQKSRQDSFNTVLVMD